MLYGLYPIATQTDPEHKFLQLVKQKSEQPPQDKYVLSPKPKAIRIFRLQLFFPLRFFKTEYNTGP